MPLFSKSPKQQPKTTLKHKVSTWFKNVLPQRCTCHKLVAAKPSSKTPKCDIEPTVKIPRKYASEKATTTFVGGHRVPYIPSQVNQLKVARSSFDPIEEKEICDHCAARNEASDTDDEY
ncbi:Aste57867_8945 [Aphanomyces stellatus]|uniref:Aste57867_8945 protein n=1 Tax=Aphanomyces stellatus TaxID=120398 RepID=A0A485KLS5_9STRA|nr:hypothetical protein As57867_008910 [Aphanomyces stellatus]VFT85829.1 Aste57867_8945 [Aphanomyces stellatus]